LNAMLSAVEFDKTKDQVMELMKAHFKPEFLNRIDETVFFKALTLPQLAAIVDIYFAGLKKLFAESNLNLEITDDAKELLATQGFNPVYGARPLKRVIRQLVENPLAKKILAQKYKSGDTVIVDVEKDEIAFK